MHGIDGDRKLIASPNACNRTNEPRLISVRKEKRF